MAHPYLSLLEARRASKNASVHQIWIDARQCSRFVEPGWDEVQPHLDGAALFLRRRRTPSFMRRSVPSAKLVAPQRI